MRTCTSVITFVLLRLVAAKPVPQVVDTCKESSTGYGSSYTNSSSSIVVAGPTGASSTIFYGTSPPLGPPSYTVTLPSSNSTFIAPTGTGIPTITLGPASTGGTSVVSTSPSPFGPPSVGYSLPPYGNGTSRVGPTGAATSYPPSSGFISYSTGTGFTPESPVTTANSTIPYGTAPTPYANYTAGATGASSSGFSAESANQTTTAHVTSFLTTQVISFVTGDTATTANDTGYYPTASPSSFTGFSFTSTTFFITGGPVPTSTASTSYDPAPYGSPSNSSFTGDGTGTGVSSSPLSAFTTSTVTSSGVASATNTPVPHTSVPGGPPGYGPPGYYNSPPPGYLAPGSGEGGTDSGWFSTWFAKSFTL